MDFYLFEKLREISLDIEFVMFNMFQVQNRSQQSNDQALVIFFTHCVFVKFVFYPWRSYRGEFRLYG